MKIHRLLSLFIVLLFIGVLRTSAQDVESTAEAQPTPVSIPAETIPDAVASPAPAENSGNDTVINVGTPAPQDTENQDNVTSILIGIVMLAVLFFGGIALYFVSQLVPGGVAKELFDAGVKAGYQMALNRAETTQNTIDDQVYTALANIQGLEVTKDAAGHYVVKPRTPVSSSVGEVGYAPSTYSVSSTGAQFDSTTPRMPDNG